MNNIITFGVADDEQFVHDMFTDIVAKMEEQIDIKCKIEHFYNTDELEDFCYDNPDTLELLFLDIQFYFFLMPLNYNKNVFSPNNFMKFTLL